MGRLGCADKRCNDDGVASQPGQSDLRPADAARLWAQSGSEHLSRFGLAASMTRESVGRTNSQGATPSIIYFEVSPDSGWLNRFHPRHLVSPVNLIPPNL